VVGNTCGSLGPDAIGQCCADKAANGDYSDKSCPGRP
jgi:hypothetical protein